MLVYESRKLQNDSDFIEYNDENLEHVSNGPDYGQPWSSSLGWEETDSKEYPDFISEIKRQILKTRIKLITE